VLATDVEIGPDGGLYVSDWLEGWNKTGKGRIWRFADNEKLASPAVQEVKRLLAEDLTKRPAAELAGLLGHADRRVRQEAQFALVAANDRARLMAVATGDQDLPRRHGIWGLGQLVRQGDGEATAALVRLLTHSDDEVRAQAARTLGDSGQGRRPELLPLLADRSPRVRLLAALAVRPGDDPVPTRDALTQMLRDNADAEPLLRHAGAMGLSHLPTESLTAVNDPAPAVRMGLLLALRRQSHPAVAAFLSDPEPRLVVEAARAINDLPIEAALPTLAALVERPGLDESLGLRVLNAHFRLGQPENAAALARLAARSDVADWLRAEAIDMLGSWAKPGRRDRVTGLSMSLPERESAPAVAAFREQLVGLFSGSDSVRQAAVKAAAALGVKEVGPVLTRLVADEKQPAATRAEALTALAALNDGRTDDLVRLALAADAPTLRIAGRRVLAQRQPAEALPLLIEAAEKATIPERQAAIDGLATLKARDALASWAERLLAGEVPPELRLEVREALEKQPSLKAQAAKYVAAQPKDDPLRDWRDSLLGGDANRGRELFVGKTALACQRCHKIEGQGGEVGPDLTAIASQQPRDYLLEAIVLPNKAIAKGFESVAVLTADGKTYFGVLKGEDETTLRLVTADGQLVTLAKDEIDERRAGPSAMPADLIKHISPREMRDLVAYLATLKGPAK
jgi:quinoprotein glucose dehydrogenase